MSLYEIKKKLDILRIFEKSTHAMKIVAISLHTQIKKVISKYKERAEIIISLAPFFQVEPIACYIFIGSDRGFCNDYNTLMARKSFEIYTKNRASAHYIVIGNELTKKVQLLIPLENIFCFTCFKEKKFSFLLEKIYQYLTEKNIKNVSIFYTYSKMITQREIKNLDMSLQKENFLVPIHLNIGHFTAMQIQDNFLKIKYESLLQYCFYMSLLAEQGARFIAMDTALKNTYENIEKNKKLYFKTRQQNINRQLQDLIGCLLI